MIVSCSDGKQNVLDLVIESFQAEGLGNPKVAGHRTGNVSKQL